MIGEDEKSEFFDQAESNRQFGKKTNNINTEIDADDILLTRSLSKELGLEKQRSE